MALDSGISWLSKMAAAEVQIALDAIAYSENLPLVLARATPTPETEAILDEVESRTLFRSLVGEKREPTFTEFLARCSRSTPEVDKLFSDLASSVFTTRFSYPNPFFRILTDHRFYRWYFAFRMARFVIAGASSQEEHHLVDLGLPLVFLKSGPVFPDHLLIVGPIWLDQYNATEDLILLKVKSVNHDISHAWLKFIRRNPMVTNSFPYPLYSNEFLYRFLFCRQRASTTGIRDKIEHVAILTNSILSRSSDVFPQFPKHSIAKLVGISSSLLARHKVKTSDSPVYSTFSVISGDSIVSDKTFALTLRGKEIHIVAASKSIKAEEADPAFDHKRDTNFTTWQSYIYESFVILRNWLANYFGVEAQAHDSGADGLTRNDRLARFICQIFHSDEGTLYSINYEEDGQPLKKFASFSTDVDSENKLKAMYDHMLSIGNRPFERSRSISYRAIDKNQVQHVKYFDSTKLNQPDSESISFPRGTKWEKWGTSAFAVPIRVNGVIWGVLELISFRADSFPVTVRTKIEEVATIISSSLFVQSILKTITDITNIIHRDDLGSDARVSQTCVKLRSLLLADSVLILLDDGSPLKFVGQSGRPDIERAEITNFDDTKAYFQPFQIFAQRGEELWAAQIGEPNFDELFKRVRGRKFYTDRRDKRIILRRLGKGGRANKRYIVCFTFPFAVLEDERWRYTLDIVFDFVSSVIDSLFAEALWEKEVRRKVGHELRRLTQTLISSTMKLSGVEGVKELWLYDIKTATEGIKAYSGVLEDTFQQIDVPKDPRLLVVDKLAAAYFREKPAPIDIRGFFNSAFQARNDEAKRNDLKLGVLPHVKLSKVRMNGFLLYEVFASLADNAYKYAPKDTEIYVWTQELNGGLHIHIANIGPELDPFEQFKIFEEGFRGELAKTVSGSGSGFGLSYAQAIMRKFSGDLFHQQHSFAEGGRWNVPDTELDRRNKSWHQFTVVFHPNTLGG